MKNKSTQVLHGGCGAVLTVIRAAFVVALITTMVLALFSCDNSRDKSFKHCELSIKLPCRFDEYNSEGTFDVSYTDTEVIVGITRMSFDAGVKDGVPATLTPLMFAKYYLARASINAEITEHGYTPYCIYSPRADVQQYYMLSFYRTDYAYFVITFAALEEIEGDLKEELLSYIDSVTYEI